MADRADHAAGKLVFNLAVGLKDGGEVMVMHQHASLKFLLRR